MVVPLINERYVDWRSSEFFRRFQTAETAANNYDAMAGW
jgi:hypothetical protein